MTSDIDEQFISQIVTTETGLEKALGTVLKSVWSAGRQVAFVDALGSFARRKDGEIEQLCHDNYQYFVPSIEELLTIRAEAANLRSKITELTDALHQSGQLLYDTRVEKFESQKMMLNTGKVIHAIEDSLAVFNAAQRVLLEIQDDNFGDALNILEELQSNSIRLIADYSFVTKLQNWIPSQINRIKEHAISELKSWLAQIREHSSIVGKMAMTRAQERLERWQHAKSEKSTPASFNLASNRSAAVSSSQLELSLLEQDDDFNLIDNSEVSVDFGPLLKALHLFDLMDRRKEFQQIYAENRRMQADIIITAPVAFKDAHETRSLPYFLQQICGFFVVEHFIVQFPQRFHSPAHVDALWDAAVARINSLILESINVCSDQASFMRIKWTQVFFMHSLEMYAYPIAPLMESTINLFYRYVELLKSEYCGRLSEAINKDRLVPLGITATSLQELGAKFSFIAADQEKYSSAKVFPFSSSVVETFDLVAEFIKNFYLFLEGVPQHNSELDDIAKKTVEESLLEEINQAFLKRIETVELAQNIQIVADCRAYMQICDDISRLLTVRRTLSRSLHGTMQARTKFEATSHHAHMKVFEAISGKANEIMSEIKYDRNPPTRFSGPSPYCQELTTYLSNLAESVLTAFPKSTTGFLYFNIFAHICGRLMGILNDPSVKAMSMTFVSNFDGDVSFLEQYVQQSIDDDVVMEAFIELRQTLRLLTADSLHEYIDPIIRSRKYAKLKTQQIVKLLEKIKEPIEKRRSAEDLALLLH